MRSQSVRRPDGPRPLDGSVIRIDPGTGAGDCRTTRSLVDRRRTRGGSSRYGLRNPFRFTPRPGTNELWIGDVGWNTWEEIDRVPNPDRGGRNFGWPCYEGAGAAGPATRRRARRSARYLYGSSGAVDAAVLRVQPRRQRRELPTRLCPPGGSSVSGLAFYGGGTYPARLRRRTVLRRLHPHVHLGDAPRRQRPARSGDRPAVRGRERGAAGNPVDLETGPGGDLYYVDLHGGDGPPHPLLAEPAADRRGSAPARPTARAAHRDLRRRRVDRPGGGHGDLRMGPRRQRHLRRRDRSPPPATPTPAAAPTRRGCGSPTTRARPAPPWSRSRSATPRRYR